MIGIDQYLTYIRSTVAVLRTLEATETAVSRTEFARLIGFPFEGNHPNRGQQSQINMILQATAALVRQSSKTDLPWHRLLNARGKPGRGVNNTSKIISLSPGQ